jgi:hypothetical protein
MDSSLEEEGLLLKKNMCHWLSGLVGHNRSKSLCLRRLFCRGGYIRRF